MLRKVNMGFRVIFIVAVVLLFSFPASWADAQLFTGLILDTDTKKPIDGALVTMRDTVVKTDQNGFFQIAGTGDGIAVRAYGYLRYEVPLGPARGYPQTIYLKPFTPKALYLTFYGIGSRVLRESALKLTEETELNSLVIDIKGDRGMIPYKSQVPLAIAVGAQKLTTVRDMKGMVDSLRKRGIYTIARIVTFKDNLLVSARPDLAIKDESGSIWHDREGLAWADPFKREVWDYAISIAIEAAQLGFDEIQFDYVRFPDIRGLRFSVANTEENRVMAISGFLSEARRRLVQYNVFLSADIFGYVCWNLNDTDIGQKLEDMAPHLDYISPMLYPSGFQFGIPGYRNPVANPYKIVRLTLDRARQRTGLSSNRFRPWLQAFRDYAFDKRHFNGPEIREQIRAAESFGSNGWMLWNPRNVYSADGIE